MEASPAVLSHNDLVTTRRERPTSSHTNQEESSPPSLISTAKTPEEIMPSPSLSPIPRATPLSKRRKPSMTPESQKMTAPSSPLQYPSRISVPPKTTIRQLYQAALKGEAGDQSYVKPAGLLSLEQVLLPAVALVEEKALKTLQAKVQRKDDPTAATHKQALEASRRLIRRSVVAAMQAVAENRQRRQAAQAVRRQERLEERRQQAAKRREERRVAHEQAQQDAQVQHQRQLHTRRQQLQRQHPRNQTLWKEVVFLTSSLQQLETEEKMWHRALEHVKEEGNRAPRNNTTTKEYDGATTLVLVPKNEAQRQTEALVQDICLQSTRIQQGLKQVLGILDSSEALRKKLYQTYQPFSGYQGVQNPKGMIRFVGQGDD